MLHDCFNLGGQQGRALFCVPGDVQIDFSVVVCRHGEPPVGPWEMAKAEHREAPSNGAEENGLWLRQTRRQRPGLNAAREAP
jgi:hypothetical protein